MAATPEQKFNAAVKVIRGLPKNGAFQPSHEMMLKFYAYFKQATEGPCNIPKPGLWSIVNRKKWEAWSDLGQMERETAMLLYVEELKNVVESLPQSEQQSDFVNTLEAFYELIDENLKVSSPSTAVNGSPACNGGDSEDHTVPLGQTMKINNNDSKKGNTEIHEPREADRAVVLNGTSDSCRGRREDNGDDGGDFEEEELSVRLDSGSDTDEFCDTTDHFIQLPTDLNTALVQVSTPIDSKREARVRFAAQVEMSDSPEVFNDSFSGRSGEWPDRYRDSSQVEMMSDRLALGTAVGSSFLPHNMEFTPHHLSESLRVNNSFNSLTGLADDTPAEDEDNDEMEENNNKSSVSDMESSPPYPMIGEENSMFSQASRVPASGSVHGEPRAWYAGRGHHASSSRRGRLTPESRDRGQSRRNVDLGVESRLDEQILLTLIRLQHDMMDISTRLGHLELNIKQQRQELTTKAVVKSKWWWPFHDMPKSSVFLFFLWPLVAPLLINFIFQRRRRARR